MFEDIKKNKFKTGFIVSGFLIIIALIIYYLCIAFEMDIYFAFFLAFVFSLTTTLISYYNCDKIVLKLAHAREATLDEDTKIVHILDALMIASGLASKPKLYVIEDAQPNAFATGRNPENSVICVTTGLLEKLNRNEIEAVLAHELSHIKNYDIRLSAIVTVMVGLIVILSDIFSRRIFWRRNKDNDSKSGNTIFLVIGLIFLIIGPILGKLMQLALSRRREYLADATAIEFTRNPDALVSALEKLNSDPNELKTASSGTAHMYIVAPFKNKKTTSLLSTHPSIEDRVNAIRNLS